MKPSLLHFGKSRSPVVLVDEFTGAPEKIVDIAAGLAPFPSASGTYYPGVRRLVTVNDDIAYRYVDEMMRVCAQFIGGPFDVNRFDLVEASFSMVTTLPEELMPQQRAPHFDSTNQNYLAVLHYLQSMPGSGTAFYRQKSTGIERVTDDNVHHFITAGQTEAEAMSGYTNKSNGFFEQIGAVEGVADRLVIYHGSLLHSGIIPENMYLSQDPREGRLTANIFIQGHH